MRIILCAGTKKFDVLYQSHIIVYENNGILVIIDKHFHEYSLRSIVIPYAEALSLLADLAGKRNHRNIGENGAGVHRFLEQTCSQDATLSFDTKFFGIKCLVLMYSISQEIRKRFLLCCALLWLYID